MRNLDDFWRWCCRSTQRTQLVQRSDLLQGHVNLWRKAGVLVAVVAHEGDWHFLLTKRQSHLREHGGQIAFAGGKFDAQTDENLTQTALREAWEELGIAPDNWKFLGNCPFVARLRATKSTQPILATCADLPPIVVNADEVAEVFTLPLQEVICPHRYGKRDFVYRNRRHHAPDLMHLHHDIWGAMALILFHVCEY